MLKKNEYEELKKQIKAELSTISAVTNNITAEVPSGRGGFEAQSVVDESVQNIRDLLDTEKE